MAANIAQAASTALPPREKMVAPAVAPSGLPVIATRCETGPEEIISHKINGLLTIDKKGSDLDKLIYQLVTDQVLQKNISNNASLINNHLNLEIIGEKWLKV